MLCSIVIEHCLCTGWSRVGGGGGLSAITNSKAQNSLFIDILYLYLYNMYMIFTYILRYLMLDCCHKLCLFQAHTQKKKFQGGHSCRGGGTIGPRGRHATFAWHHFTFWERHYTFGGKLFTLWGWYATLEEWQFTFWGQHPGRPQCHLDGIFGGVFSAHEGASKADGGTCLVCHPRPPGCAPALLLLFLCFSCIISSLIYCFLPPSKDCI